MKVVFYVSLLLNYLAGAMLMRGLLVQDWALVSAGLGLAGWGLAGYIAYYAFREDQ